MHLCKDTTELDIFSTTDAAVDMMEWPGADSPKNVCRMSSDLLQQWHLAKEGEDVIYYLQRFG